jgi:hypothetical protein
MIKIFRYYIVVFCISINAYSMDEPLVEEFSIQDATMTEVIDLMNTSISKYKIQSIEKIEIDFIEDKSIAFKELKLKNIPIKELVRGVCSWHKGYYYEISALPIVITIKRTYEMPVFLSSDCDFVKLYSLAHPDFSFKKKDDLRSLLVEYGIIENKFSLDIVYSRDNLARFEIRADKAKALNEIVSLYEKGYRIEKVRK